MFEHSLLQQEAARVQSCRQFDRRRMRRGGRCFCGVACGIEKCTRSDKNCATVKGMYTVSIKLN